MKTLLVILAVAAGFLALGIAGRWDAQEDAPEPITQHQMEYNRLQWEHNQRGY